MVSNPQELDVNKELDAQMVRELHFGGGEDHHGVEHKSKKEVMEELIAKSKYYKTLRKQEKEEDEQKLESLDDTFKELQRSGTLNEAFRKMTKEDRKATKSVDDYDKYGSGPMTKELLFEIRAQPSERSKTPEETAAIEAKKLEDLEYQRKKRMRARGGDSDDDDDDNVSATRHVYGDVQGRGGSREDLPFKKWVNLQWYLRFCLDCGAQGMPKGGFAARRAKRKKAAMEKGEDDALASSGDSDADDSGSEEESEGSEEEEEGEEESEEEEGDDEDDDMDPNYSACKVCHPLTRVAAHHSLTRVAARHSLTRVAAHHSLTRVAAHHSLTRRTPQLQVAKQMRPDLKAGFERMARLMAKDRAAMQSGEAEDDFGQGGDNNDNMEGSGDEEEEEDSGVEDEEESSDEEAEAKVAAKAAPNKADSGKLSKVVVPERLRSGPAAMTSGRSEATGALEPAPDLPFTFVAPSTYDVRGRDLQGLTGCRDLVETD
eukprot:1188197-Prorocentrum_minimum.AAC.2